MAFENLKGFLHVQVLGLLQYGCLIQMLTRSKSRLKRVEKVPTLFRWRKQSKEDAHQDICPAFAQLHHHKVWLDCLQEYSC